MPEGEPRYIPEWAQRERSQDLAWIRENLHIFWPVAQAAYAELGRGAIMVDTTVQPTGKGHPFGYLPQVQIEELGGEDEIRMVSAYDPGWELVTIMLKELERVSSYRVGLPHLRPRRRKRR